jgi:hypothetical protein
VCAARGTGQKTDPNEMTAIEMTQLASKIQVTVSRSPLCTCVRTACVLAARLCACVCAFMWRVMCAGVCAYVRAFVWYVRMRSRACVVCVHVFVRMRVRERARALLSVCGRVFVCVRERARAFVCVRERARAFVCVPVRTCLRVIVCVPVCACVCASYMCVRPCASDVSHGWDVLAIF